MRGKKKEYEDAEVHKVKIRGDWVEKSDVLRVRGRIGAGIWGFGAL
jgi:hypothetical protein